eukprot:5081739-Amphidinium_carterae.1
MFLIELRTKLPVSMLRGIVFSALALSQTLATSSKSALAGEGANLKTWVDLLDLADSDGNVTAGRQYSPE